MAVGPAISPAAASLSTISFRPPRYGDIAAIARDLRAIEVLEARVAGHTPKSALRMGMRCSPVCWTVEIDGRAQGMFGVVPVSMIDRTGRPWFLCTEALVRLHRRAWLTEGRRYVAELAGWFPRLENHVHADNAASLRWLARVGFAVEDEIVQIGGHPFRRFTKG